MSPSEIEALAIGFFDAIQAGDIAAVGNCYADDAVIWHNTDGLENTKAENLAVLAGFIRAIPQRAYQDRRLSVFPGGFVQQHRLQGERRNGAKVTLSACIVCAVADGVITRLDEYFDQAQVAAWSGS